jgi:hypothetical protein
MAHTPGPWCYQEKSDAYTHIVRGPANRFICQLSPDRGGEAEANAHLIAAGPEMLAALKTVLAGIRGKVIEDAILIDLSSTGPSAPMQHLSEIVSAAIAKAERG